MYLYINLACLSVCLYPINVKTAEPIGPKFFVPREGLWIIKISNICLYQNSIVIKFFKILKIREIFCKNPRIIFVYFYDVHKENMFTINLEDGRETPPKARKKGAKRLEILVYYILFGFYHEGMLWLAFFPLKPTLNIH